MCLWCDINFQVINYTKSLAHVIGTRGVHIRVFVMLLIKLVFKDTNIFIIKKSAKKGLINDYSYRVISSISCLQDTSSEVIKSNIQFNSISMYLSNLTTMSDIYSFGTGPSTSSNSNQINHQKGSIFIGDNNFKKNILMRHIL